MPGHEAASVYSTFLLARSHMGSFTQKPCPRGLASNRSRAFDGTHDVVARRTARRRWLRLLAGYGAPDARSRGSENFAAGNVGRAQVAPFAQHEGGAPQVHRLAVPPARSSASPRSPALGQRRWRSPRDHGGVDRGDGSHGRRWRPEKCEKFAASPFGQDRFAELHETIKDEEGCPATP